MTGTLSKMRNLLAGDNTFTDLATVDYQIPIGEQLVPLNTLIGSTIRLHFTGQIFCSNCGRKTKKSFSQGHCYPCFKKLASCDMCIMKPETCHFDQGTCREPEWAEQFCFQPHYVYLANSSGVKVGITRGTQIPTRWMDQGAIQALPIMKVSTRLLSGLVEVIIAEHVSDKTNWRKMLKNEVETLDLCAIRDELLRTCDPQLQALKAEYDKKLDTDSMQWLKEQPIDIHYPVKVYPTKVSSFNFDKNPTVEGVLMGIKGQYLLFDTGVINIRKFSAYEVELNWE
ncbi:MAG: hypothetical protein COA99_02805 [Moraxellaceae bacterium]|nr:MAG: hypothetical protein COA99_02805 [Moraxellaceae bacterium]